MLKGSQFKMVLSIKFTLEEMAVFLQELEESTCVDMFYNFKKRSILHNSIKILNNWKKC